LLLALLLAAGGVIIEALLFRGLLELGHLLGGGRRGLEIVGAVVFFVVSLLFVQNQIMNGALRLGRGLETRLRIAFLAKIPRLHDRYFQSRLMSDMAERSHSIHLLRNLPYLGAQFIQLLFTLILTTLAIAWLSPASALFAGLSALLAVGLPLATQSFLTERDLRVRTHLGALGRFYLDGLLGLVPIRAHSAERVVRREHERLLVEWAWARLGLLRAGVWVEGLQALSGFGLAAWLLFQHLAWEGEMSNILLLTYWALQLPGLGQEIALLAGRYPTLRNITLRLLEPLGAPEATMEEETQGEAGPPLSETSGGMALSLREVQVRAAGRTILEEINLNLEPGSHIAIVGPSGAGKSSLVGLLLGWHRPAQGQILVDGAPLTGQRLPELRRQTAWVDPAVHLWNRSLLDNLRYGQADNTLPLGPVIEQAELLKLLASLPEGLQQSLGEGGALASGGEGQRVRLGRAMLRPDARLVILDEPFRGLDRDQRRALLARTRRYWQEATLLCITHDVGETQSFERVLVVETGRIVEDGSPAELAAQPGSRYGALLEAEAAVWEEIWSDTAWRRLWLQNGQLEEEDNNELRKETKTEESHGLSKVEFSIQDGSRNGKYTSRAGHENFIRGI
jgi:ATP-binding cassette subfamily B protein